METELDDIKNCYALIFSTQKGTVVLNPNLGWNLIKFFSKPIESVELPMKTELMHELNLQEPRATVYNVLFNRNYYAQGKMSAKIMFNYNGYNEVVEV